MSEPGRFFSTGSMTLVTRIFARRLYQSNEIMPDHEPIIPDTRSSSKKALIESADNIYYINDGIYGTFNAIIFHHEAFLIHYLKMKSNDNNSEQFKSVIFGPTCNSLDCIANSIDLPLLEIGDVLWFPDVGAYTNASASNFNGFQTKKYVFIWKN